MADVVVVCAAVGVFLFIGIASNWQLRALRGVRSSPVFTVGDDDRRYAAGDSHTPGSGGQNIKVAD